MGGIKQAWMVAALFLGVSLAAAVPGAAEEPVTARYVAGNTLFFQDGPPQSIGFVSEGGALAGVDELLVAVAGDVEQATGLGLPVEELVPQEPPAYVAGVELIVTPGYRTVTVNDDALGAIEFIVSLHGDAPDCGDSVQGTGQVDVTLPPGCTRLRVHPSLAATTGTVTVA